MGDDMTGFHIGTRLLDGLAKPLLMLDNCLQKLDDRPVSTAIVSASKSIKPVDETVG